MPRNAQCSGCGRRVRLTADGECPAGHVRSMLRDIREGALPTDAPTRAVRMAPPAPPARESDVLAQVMGKAVVIVPVAAILAFGLWTGYEQGVGTGMSIGAAIILSVASLGATIGAAFVWAAMRRGTR